MHFQSRPKSLLFNLVILIYLVSLTISSADLSKDARIRLGKHTDGVNSVVFSPDGQTLASASAKVIKLWSVDNRLGMDISRAHRNSVNSVAFSPNGKMLASASGEKIVKLWDVKNRSELYTFKGHDRGVNSVAFSPNGKMLASASVDHTIKLWDVESGGELYTFRGHNRSVNSVIFSPDGKILASASEDNTVRLWTVEDKQNIGYFTKHSKDVYSVAFSPDGTMLASASEDNTVRLWNVESRKYIDALEGHRGSVNAVVFSPNGRFLVSVGDDDTVKLWDVEGKHQIDTLTGHSKNVKSVAFSSNGITLASGSDDGTIYLWDLSLFGVTPDIPTASTRQESPIGRVSRLPLSTTGPAGVIAQFGPSGSVYTVDLSPDGRLIASGGDDNTFKLWDVASGRELKIFTEHDDWVECVAFSPSGRILASASIDGSVKLWGVYSHRKLATFKHSDWVESVAFSPDGRILATSGNNDGSIGLWDVNKKKKINTFTGHSAGVSSVAFSPDGRLLASASYDSSIKLWDVVSKREFNTFSGHSRPVSSVTFSPDGSVLASGSTDNTVRLWDVFSRRKLATFEHEGYVESVAFSPDGRLLASASVDSTIRLWDVDRKDQIATLEGHKNGVTSIVFSFDGMTLLSGSRDRKVFLWDLSYFGIGKLRLDPDIPNVFGGQPLATLPEEPEVHVDVPKVSQKAAQRENSSSTTLLKDSEPLVSGRVTSQYDRDATQPVIVITSPTERVVPSTVKQVEIAGIATDDSGIYEFTVKGVEVPVSASGRFNTIVLLGYGDNEIIVTATDTQNNTATERFIITRETAKSSLALKTTPSRRDTTGPEIRLLSPVARIQRGAKVKIRLTTNSTIVTGTVADPSGVYEVMVNGIEAQVSGERFTAMVPLDYGDNLIRVTATDTLRNTATEQFTIAREGVLHAAKSGTNYALLFATDSYIHWPNLWNPLFDAEAIRVDLQEIYGFQVELVHNPTREKILETLLKYAKKMYTDEDQLLIFFAGHGYFNREFREGYLVAHDTKRADDDITMGSYLSHSEFRNIIDRMSCKHIFLVMDTCYSGTFDQRIAMRGEEYDVSKPLSNSDIKRKLKYTTRWYLTSGGKEQVSDGMPGRHSPFARGFLEALRNSGGRDNILTIDEVLMYMDRIEDPKPRSSGFGTNEPGSDFLFIAK